MSNEERDHQIYLKERKEEIDRLCARLAIAWFEAQELGLGQVLKDSFHKTGSILPHNLDKIEDEDLVKSIEKYVRER